MHTKVAFKRRRTLVSYKHVCSALVNCTNPRCHVQTTCKRGQCFAESALGQLQELHKVEPWMAILAEVQCKGWCDDEHAPACPKEDLVYLQERRASPARSIQAIYDCFFGLPVCQEC